MLWVRHREHSYSRIADALKYVLGYLKLLSAEFSHQISSYLHSTGKTIFHDFFFALIASN